MILSQECIASHEAFGVDNGCNILIHFRNRNIRLNTRSFGASRKRKSAAKWTRLSAFPPVESLFSSQPGLKIGVTANSIVFLLGAKVLLQGLSWSGYMSSLILGTLIYSAFGLYGYLLVCLYFVLGSFVTKLRMDVKENEGTAEKMGGRRGVGSVIGSGAAGMVCAVLSLASNDPKMKELMVLGFVSSFASKLGDTVSSEIGKSYGRQTFLATTFSQVPRGTEGAVSMEGSFAGGLAIVLIVMMAFLFGLVDSKGFSSAVLGALVANYCESVLGALAQGKVSWLTNDVVNTIQVFTASIIATSWFILM